MTELCQLWLLDHHCNVSVTLLWNCSFTMWLLFITSDTVTAEHNSTTLLLRFLPIPAPCPRVKLWLTSRISCCSSALRTAVLPLYTSAADVFRGGRATPVGDDSALGCFRDNHAEWSRHYARRPASDGRRRELKSRSHPCRQCVECHDDTKQCHIADCHDGGAANTARGADNHPLCRQLQLPYQCRHTPGT